MTRENKGELFKVSKEEKNEKKRKKKFQIALREICREKEVRL